MIGRYSPRRNSGTTCSALRMPLLFKVDSEPQHNGVDALRSRPTLSQKVFAIAEPVSGWTRKVIFWAIPCAVAGAAVAATLIKNGSGPDPVFTWSLIVAVHLIALFQIAHAARSEHVAPDWRTMWKFHGAAIASAMFIGLGLVVAQANGEFGPGAQQSFTPLLPQLLVIAGLLSLRVAPRGGIEAGKLILDAATVIAGAAVVAWFDLSTMSPSGAAQWYNTIFMHASLSLSFVIVLIASFLSRRLQSARESAILTALAAAPLVHAISVALLLIERHLNGSISGFVQYSGPVAGTLVAVAAWIQLHGSPGSVRNARLIQRTVATASRLLPYVAVVPAFALLLHMAGEESIRPLGGVIYGGVVIAILTLLRRVVLSREMVQLGAESAARQGEARFRALIQHSSDVITIVDEDFTIRFVSPSFESVFGHPADKLEGTSLIDLLHPDDVIAAAEFTRELLAPGTADGQATGAPPTVKREWRIRHANGSWHNADNIGTNLLDEPVINGFVINTRDVTEQSVIREQYMHQAFHDPLTDLANRSLFLYQVGHALARTQRQGHSVSVLFLDLDNFKNVNDSLGHAAGDRLLVEAARRLATCVRDTDVIARLGGDEFAVLLEDSSPVSDEIGKVAERIGAALSTPFSLSGKEVFVSASIGIARTSAGESSEELVRNADVAMYVAKTNGKGKHVFFEPEMHTAALERLVVEADLRRAIEREEFILQFQPIVVLQTGEVYGAEALVRWQCRERGTVPPGVFIPITEETGLVVPLGRMVLRNACKAASRWERDHGRPLRVTVNLSGRQLQEEIIIDHVREALAESGLPPERLVLEITESMLMQHTEVSMARLIALKSLGVSLAIDDFGTGYSSLSYLQRYPIDILKIDKGFVDDIDKGEDGPVLASAIVALGETLRMRTVAEGIETEAQRGQLLQLGCELGQGFLFAPPLGAEEFESLVVARGMRSPLRLHRRDSANERAA